MIVSSGLWGAAWGLMGAGASALDEPRPYVAASMAASAAGIFLSSGFAKQRELSRKRVSLINAGGFLGSAIGLGLPYLLDAQGARIYMFGLLAGGIIGTVSAVNLTSGLDFVETGDSTASLSLTPRFAISPAGSGERGSKVDVGGALQLTF